MKKTLSLLMLIAVVSVVHAQSPTFGIKGGVNHNILRAKSPGAKLGIMGTGAHLGLVTDFSFSDNFSIQPNLLFQMKTVRQNDDESISMYAVEIPINFLYKTGGFFAGAGPNFSYGISAKAKEDGQDDEDFYEDPDGPADAFLKRFEIGANVLMGYRFTSGLTLSAHYTPGISNLLNDAPDKTFYNTRVFGLSIGYMFK